VKHFQPLAPTLLARVAPKATKPLSFRAAWWLVARVELPISEVADMVVALHLVATPVRQVPVAAVRVLSQIRLPVRVAPGLTAS
jgi:hypothetical protein